jgi:hypothetical protein
MAETKETHLAPYLNSFKKCEICISGMATLSRHSHPTQPKCREEKRAWLYNNQFQNRRHKPLTEVAFSKF